jgi:Rho-binding antiterminator
MEENYKPVSCDFYDELEALATMKKSCDIIFINNESRSKIRASIADLYTRDKVEYMKTSSGLEIRLDKLVEVDGKIASNYC